LRTIIWFALGMPFLHQDLAGSKSPVFGSKLNRCSVNHP
jgi:hypothetical protein